MEAVLIELKLHTAILQEMGKNIAALRHETAKAREEGVAKGMQAAMEQMTSAFKGTPMEGIIANMIAKAGGNKNG